MIFNGLAIVIGVLLLAASANYNITHAGGYGTPLSFIVIALAAGVAGGSLVIGKSWRDRRFGLAFMIALALVAGETYGLFTTAEQLVAAREDDQAPLNALAQARRTAKARLAAAEAALKASRTTSARIEQAIRNKAEADRNAQAKAAEKSCAANCKDILLQQASSAGTELSNARTELAEQRTAAVVAVNEARAALDGLPAPRSATPLADRLNLPAWSIDIFKAAMGSIAINGLAACLLAFGAHGQRHRPTASPGPIDRTQPVHDLLPVPEPEPTPKSKPRSFQKRQTALPAPQAEKTSEPPGLKEDSVAAQAARFALASIMPAPGGHAYLDDIMAAYRHWCETEGVTRHEPRVISEALTTLFKSARLTGKIIDGRPAVMGAQLRTRAVKSYHAA